MKYFKIISIYILSTFIVYINMKIDLKWFSGGNWMLMVNGIKIICDPVLCPVGTIHNYGFFKSKRINQPVFQMMI